MRENRGSVRGLGSISDSSPVCARWNSFPSAGNVDLERGVLTLPTPKAGSVQYVRLNEEAKGLPQGFIPGNKSVWVFPSLNPDTHADPRNFYRGVFLSHGWYPHLSASHLQQEIEKVSAFVRQVSRQ